MYDFKYDGKYLSDINCMLATFDGSSGFTTKQGCSLNLQTIKASSTQKYQKYGVSYDDYLTDTWQIAKQKCINPDDRYFTIKEIRNIMRWLNSEKYKKLYLVDDEYLNIYFMATFNVSKIMSAGKCIGFELNLICNSSFGYETKTVKSSITDQNKTILLSIDNDRKSFIYPKIDIEILENGDLEIASSTESDRKLILHDCSVGDKIFIDCENRVIMSSNATHNLPSSFNFIFPRINYSFNNDDYKININLNSNVSIELEQVRKVGVI